MADNKCAPLSSGVGTSFRQLSATASRLNATSDEIAKLFSEIEVSLKQLNLGVSAWFQFASEEEESGYFTAHFVGYEKFSKGWSIALRRVQGHTDDPDSARFETWLFSEAPRLVRIKAIDGLPGLIDQLNAEAENLVKHAQEKLREAAEVAKAIKAAAVPSTKTAAYYSDTLAAYEAADAISAVAAQSAVSAVAAQGAIGALKAIGDSQADAVKRLVDNFPVAGPVVPSNKAIKK
jgi:hypothetical protein